MTMTYNQIMQKAGKRISISLLHDSQIMASSDEIIRGKRYFNSSLVGTIMKGLEVELNKLIPFDYEYNFKNTASYGNESADSVTGPYFIKEYEYDASRKTYIYQLYDEFIAAMIDYKPINVTYPCTVYNYFVALISFLGWETNISTLPNGDKLMDHDIYEGIGFTYRTVLDDIGQATGTLFKINDGVIEACELVSSNTDFVAVDDDILRNQNIDFGKHFGPINSIVLTRSGESDSIYMRDETLNVWNEFRIVDNQLMNNNNRSEFLPDLYDKLSGIEFDVYDTQLVGYGDIEPLQLVKFETGNNEYESYVFNCEEEFYKGYKQSIYTEYPEETSTNYKAASKEDNLIKQTYIIVNKQNQTIESLVQTVEDLGDGVQGNTTQISQLVQDAAGLTGYFANANGAKYIKLTSEGIKVSKDEDSAYVQITEDGVDIYNDDKVKVASMKANNFYTTQWVLSETRGGNCMNIFRRRV